LTILEASDIIEMLG